MVRKIVGIVVVLGFSAGAMAGYTTYNTSPPGSEQNLDDIFTALYGAGATVVQFHDFADGGGGVSGTVNVHSPNTNLIAQDFADGASRFVPRVRYAGDTSTFGWVDDTNGGAEEAILQATGSGIDPATTFFNGWENGGTLSTLFRVYLEDLTVPNTNKWYSDDLNQSHADQLLTFLITPVGMAPRLVFAWEDRVVGGGADDDYNDLVVEFQAIPVPAAALLGLLGLGTVGAVRRRLG